MRATKLQTCASRTFKISGQFVEDVRREPLSDDIASLRKPLLIMHAPRDENVGMEGATEVILAARHPKSFIPLNAADHLFPIGRTSRSRCKQWRVVPLRAGGHAPGGDIRANMRVMETGEGGFANKYRCMYA